MLPRCLSGDAVTRLFLLPPFRIVRMTHSDSERYFISTMADYSAEAADVSSPVENLLRSSALGELARHLREGKRTVVVSGLAGSARALVLAAISKLTGRTVLFITRSNRDVEEFRPDSEFFYCALNGLETTGGNLITIPASERDPYDGTSPHAEVLEQRALAFYRTSTAAVRNPQIIITSLRALAERTVSPDQLKSAGLSLKIGDDMPIELIVDQLIASGYVREEPVGSVGEFSVRGGILDIFSPAHESPHRIEFFGDTVDSIREFDPETQRSVGRLNESIIVPMRELCIRREDFMKWADRASQHWNDDRFRRDLRAHIAHAGRGEAFPGWEYLVPLTKPLNSSGFDYFKEALLVMDEPAEIERTAVEFYDMLEERYARMDDEGALALPPASLFLMPEELRSRLNDFARIELRLLGCAASATDERFLPLAAAPPTFEILKAARQQEPDNATPELPESPEKATTLFLLALAHGTPEVEIISQSPRRYHGRIQHLIEDLQSGPFSTIFVMPSLGLAERVRDMLSEYAISAELCPSLDMTHRAAERVITVGRLANGFTLPAAALSLLIETDVFGDIERQAPPPLTRKRPQKKKGFAAFMSDLGDLKVGDYVVHIDHGIGQFQGLRQIAVAASGTAAQFNMAEGLVRSGGEREFMLLTYAEGAKLYVPVERLDLIQKFSAAEGNKPHLDRLGGVGWEKTKARAKRAMRDLAEELLKLYAERKLVSGFAYGEDTPWQHEFEDAFEYQLTPDQISAVEDVKAGMQSSEPMDRLIVGDVGYGKTEVAMRAAFKAVSEGKQVAVLAPTTVLVYQHYKTFQQRFGAFPVRVEMLSRFRSQKEQKEVVKTLESGIVDIVVGTHRLLSKDITIKDLGLLIVDEEQRFGVAHKERIKQMRKRVDVISMSATPIPRTLNMSLAGLRDMSIIETPPRDRLAIQTHVVQFSESVLRSAIELELQRGGQVFFVHNRVETIYSIAELIGRLVREARIGVGHGQMGEKELEEVMLKFIRHDLDVLVSTTIIENGIDIPLANTIIINRADRYGLSQLYQLRGRVGRSNRRAYAYLLIPPEDELTDIARRRLAAIREFSDLGAGFRIAALDLELRGAGNLLGAQQSGHIESIGFDLYTSMLERTVRELKGEQIDEESSANINLGVDIRIPEDFIRDMSQRLRAYKRISSAKDEDELNAIRSEIADRFGPIPESVASLFTYARLRREASRIGVVSIDREADRLTIKFAESARIDPEKLVGFVSKGTARFTPAGVLKLQIESDDDQAVMHEVQDILTTLQN